MGRLTDQLDALGQSSRPTMGFGRAHKPTHNAAMLLIAEATDSRSLPRLEEAGTLVDAFVLDAGAGHSVPPEEALNALEGKTWGVRGSIAVPDGLDALKDAGCDFIVVAGDEAPGALLRDDDMARGFVIRPGLSDEQARALEDLPFEFLVLDAGGQSWPISMAGLMHLQGTVSMVSKHIFLKISRLPPPGDLPLLRDMPVSGLVLDLPSVDRATLAEGRKALDRLEPRRPRQPVEPTPTLTPPPGAAMTASSDAGDDDWDGEYEDHARTRPRLRRRVSTSDLGGFPWTA